MKDKPDTTPKCTSPCGSIDCMYGCCRGMPWTGSAADIDPATRLELDRRKTAVLIKNRDDMAARLRAVGVSEAAINSMLHSPSEIERIAANAATADQQYVGPAIKDMIGVGTDKPAAEEQQYTGGSVDYYRVKITNPTSDVDAYTAECNDIIEALGMNYAEGNAFKAIWRKCAARTLGLSKKGYTDGLYDSEKVVFFGQRMVAQEKYK